MSARLKPVLLLLILLAACQPLSSRFNPQASPAASQSGAETSSDQSPTASASQEIPESGPTPVVVGSLLPAQSETLPQPTPLPVPEQAAEQPSGLLRFVFPTPGLQPVSAWRPPLYATPWAPTPFDHFFFSRPIAANEINWPLADYRYGGIFLPDVVHTGIDIPSGVDTPVLAAGAGRVTWTGYGLYRGVEDVTDPYGLAVAIKHDFGYQGNTLYTVYGHLDRIDVLLGQHVEAGDLIGLSGQTGKVTGPHLHFEVRVGRNNYFVSRNPELWLAPPQGWGVLVARVQDSSGDLLASHTINVLLESTGQTWVVKTYGKGTVNSDEYYLENMVLGDLPAGEYVVWLPFEGTTYDLKIEIKPGMVTYFTFRGKRGYNTNLPPTPGANFTPPAPDSSATP
jgi:murein DD-endopeptidase MepM/ murein hydrolase activator NlpD